MIESEASVKGRVVAEMLSHFTNDLKIGKKIKSGELRKRMIEPPWIPPAMFNLTGINMDHFTMKLLSLKENPNTDYVILQLLLNVKPPAMKTTTYSTPFKASINGYCMEILAPHCRHLPRRIM